MQTISRVQWIKGGIVLFLSISIGFLWYFFSSTKTSPDQVIPGLFGFLVHQKIGPWKEFQSWQDRHKMIQVIISGNIQTTVATGIFEHTNFPAFSTIDTSFSGTMTSDITTWESDISVVHHIDTQTGILISHSLEYLQSDSGDFIQIGRYSSNNTLLVYPDLSLREQFLKSYQKKWIQISSPTHLQPCQQQRSIISNSGSSYECTRKNEISTATVTNGMFQYSYSGQDYRSSLRRKSGESGVFIVSGTLSSIPREMRISLETTSDKKRQKSYTLQVSYSYGSSVSGSGVIEVIVTPTEKKDIKTQEQFLEWGKVMKVLQGR